jgi:hypothetical protein
MLNTQTAKKKRQGLFKKISRKSEEKRGEFFRRHQQLCPQNQILLVFEFAKNGHFHIEFPLWPSITKNLSR